MRNLSHNENHEQSFDQWRQRMLDETSRFIEWGLAHPEEVRRIPTHRIGRGNFSDTLRHTFWSLVFRDPDPSK